jgi:hypothetical protein
MSVYAQLSDITWYSEPALLVGWQGNAKLRLLDLDCVILLQSAPFRLSARRLHFT